MMTLFILPPEGQTRLCLSNDVLPLYYMGDFTILGLRVAGFDEALRLLDKHRFSLVRKADVAEVEIDGAAGLQQVMQLLRQHLIECDLTDIIDQVYQG